MQRTVLIADDNEDLREVLTYQLHLEGYRVLGAADGAEAIEKARSEKPDIILLDVLMTGMDGAEAGMRLKLDPQTSKIPVIFLTSLVLGGEVALTALGKDDVILPKSTELTVLLAKIREILTHTK